MSTYNHHCRRSGIGHHAPGNRRRPFKGAAPFTPPPQPPPDLDTFLESPAAFAVLAELAGYVGRREARRLAARVLTEMEGGA